MRDMTKTAGEGPNLPDPVGKQRDWATLVSELRKDFRQTRGGSPPEQYRNAIDRYFETISRTPVEPANAP